MVRPLVNLLSTHIPLQEVDADTIASPDFQKLIDDMVDTMMANYGVGLASNQIGEKWQLAVLHQGFNPKGEPFVIINPQPIRWQGQKKIELEGCLSFPGHSQMIERYETANITALDRHGKPFRLRGYNLFARCIQHEFDHLQGMICFEHNIKIEHEPEPDKTS